MEPIRIPTPEELHFGMVLTLAEGVCLGTLAAVVIRGVVKWVGEKLSTLAD